MELPLLLSHSVLPIIQMRSDNLMQEGEVVELGSHPELIALDGLYHEMWGRQIESSKQALSENASSLSLLSQPVESEEDHHQP